MEWDPIGVAGIDEAQDEYDCMISPLLRLLFDGADKGALLDWIRTERVDHFGLSAASPADVSSSQADSRPGGAPTAQRPDRVKLRDQPPLKRDS